jgi:tetratricopeptide (TPR) repeat protein
MVGRYPKGKRAFDGYTGIGDAYFLEGKYNEAVVAYNDALKTFPDHKNSGVIYYKMGSAYQKLRINDKASDYYRKARQISPMSFESNMAPKELPSTPRIIIFEDQPKSVATPGVADSGSGYYYVQAGYFRTKANAEKLNNKLKQKGYESSIAVQMKLGMDFYRVKVGHFKTKAEAEEVSKRMRKEGYLTKVCR